MPSIARQIGACECVYEGWISGLYEALTDKDDIQLAVVAPIDCRAGYEKIQVKEGCFYGYASSIAGCQKELLTVFKKVIADFEPDVVHIFGTEQIHSLAMVEAYSAPDRTLIHLQGLVSYIAKHFNAFLPSSIVKRKTLYEIYRKNNIEEQQKRFLTAGENEVKCIKAAKYITGRTEWDYACVKLINPNVEYFHISELLRTPFYCDKKWKYENCEPHSVFMSQGSYPLKGLHIAIEAIAHIKNRYDDVKLYVAGRNILDTTNSFKKKITQGSYSRYLQSLIQRYKLENTIFFLGDLDAEKMLERYLLANVYILPSVIENSPNSLGEAMMLGVPAVASFTGGIPSMVEHGKTGYLYQSDAAYMLQYYIEKIFESKDLEQMSEEERISAQKRFDRKTVIEGLSRAYTQMTI